MAALKDDYQSGLFLGRCQTRWLCERWSCGWFWSSNGRCSRSRPPAEWCLPSHWFYSERLQRRGRINQTTFSWKHQINLLTTVASAWIRGRLAELKNTREIQHIYRMFIQHNVTETSAEQFSGNIWIKNSLLGPQIFTSSSSLLQVFTPSTSGEIYVHRITAHSCRSHLWVLKNFPPSCECNYKYVKKGAENGGSDLGLNLLLLTATGGWLYC